MIKKKLLTMGLVTAMVFALTACGNQQAPVTVVTSNSEQTTEVTSEPEETTEPVEEVTTEEEPVDETEEATVTELSDEEKEETGDEDDVEDIEKKTGYEGLLVGTQVGVSGKNVYVMIDGEGLLLDFEGIGVLMEIKEGDHFVGAKGMNEYAVIEFRAYCGETGITRSADYKSLGTIKVGEFNVDRYWNEELGLYEAYCKDLDCAIYGKQGDFDYDSKEVLASFESIVENNLKYFNANE